MAGELRGTRAPCLSGKALDGCAPTQLSRAPRPAPSPLGVLLALNLRSSDAPESQGPAWPCPGGNHACPEERGRVGPGRAAVAGSAPLRSWLWAGNEGLWGGWSSPVSPRSGKQDTTTRQIDKNISRQGLFRAEGPSPLPLRTRAPRGRRGRPSVLSVWKGGGRGPAKVTGRVAVPGTRAE